MNRRTFLTGTAGCLTLSSGCIGDPASESPDDPATNELREASTPSSEATPPATSQLPAVCGDAVRFENLSPASRKEFKTALTEGGLTRPTLNFEIVNETKDDNNLYTIGDEIGSETCILYNETYYFGTVGPGIPVNSPQEGNSNEFQYTLQFERAKRYNSVIDTSSN